MVTQGFQKLDATPQWVLLSYRVPREPSTPRIAIWRKLKDLGVAQVGDGLVALPHDARTKEQLEWVAASVLEADGEAIVWIATPTPRQQHLTLLEQLERARQAEYEELVAEIEQTGDISMRTIQRWRRTWRRIDRRDHAPGPLREQARHAIAVASETLREPRPSGKATR